MARKPTPGDLIDTADDLNGAVQPTPEWVDAPEAPLEAGSLDVFKPEVEILPPTKVDLEMMAGRAALARAQERLAAFHEAHRLEEEAEAAKRAAEE